MKESMKRFVGAVIFCADNMFNMNMNKFDS